MDRREFLTGLAALSAGTALGAEAFDVVAIDRARVLKGADRYLTEAPVTVTASGSPRSAGGQHDFFSEGDYWWPDPNNPDGPYIQRDGMTNPGELRGTSPRHDPVEPDQSRPWRRPTRSPASASMPTMRRYTCAPGSSTMPRA